MGKRNNTITIAAIIGAFILGTGAISLVDASPASDTALIAALNEIRLAIVGITPTQTVTVQSLVGPEGPRGADGQDGAPGLSCENQLIINDVLPVFVVDPECAATVCDPNGDGAIDASELQSLFDANGQEEVDAVEVISQSEFVAVGDDNGVLDTSQELAELNFFLPALQDFVFFPCTIIF